MAVKRNEQLVVEFPPASYTLEGTTWIPGASDERLSSYSKTTISGNYTGFYMEQTIDLAGFFHEEDTVLLPQLYLIQDPGYYKCLPADNDFTNSAGLLQIVEIVSTRRLDMPTVFSDLFNLATLPGQPLSIYDKQQIVLGEERSMMPNLPVYDPTAATIINSPGFTVLNRSSSFGYAEKIANQKLFAYRLMLPYLTGDGDNFVCPGLRMRIEVGVDTVSSPEYIFALKRNVELNQV